MDLVRGFAFPLRSSELQQLRCQCVSILNGSSGSYILMHIRKRKTDQSVQGRFEVYTSMIVYYALAEHGVLPGDLLRRGERSAWFFSVFLRRLRRLVRWTSSSLGMGPTYFSLRTLRAGCASTFCANGISHDSIMRFGRWRSDAFRIYLRGDNLDLRSMSRDLVNDFNLLSQIHRANDSRGNTIQMELSLQIPRIGLGRAITGWNAQK